MRERSYALSDGNSFYCSCERVFDAKLKAVPVAVLSNNDGCAIARTPEAKALGIGMGEPFFKIRDKCRTGGVRVFSSNYALYGDMSRRLNDIYRDFSPRVEIYSIDESFIDLSDIKTELRETLARDMRTTARQWVGIPTCVGIGPTKTLAKLANHIAKGTPELDGVCDLTSVAAQKHWLGRVQLEDIWGVGRAGAARLRALGCRTVADVALLDPRPVRAGMTVVGERMIYELRGVSCMQLEDVAPTRKGCAVTRSFSSRVSDLAKLEQAVATYAARLGEKLRRGGLGTDHVTVFVHTSEHDRSGPQRSAAMTVDLPEASNDTVLLTKAARWGARRIWRDGFAYSKAGLITTDLVPLACSQRALPGIGQFDRGHSAALMSALDRCNQRWGRETLVLAAAGFAKTRTWSTKFEMRSPRYTTRFEDMMSVGS